MYELKTFEDFGAVGDYNVQTGIGTDDTAAIQEAIDWAWEGDVTIRAILMTDKNFLCGNITTHPVLTIIATGRHTSNFICKGGTTGKWWSDRGNGAQKLMLSGIAWYGRNEPGLTHVCAFGDTGIQFGSEGILQGLWMRDAPNAYGLLVDGNVGIPRDLTLQSCEHHRRSPEREVSTKRKAQPSPAPSRIQSASGPPRSSTPSRATAASKERMPPPVFADSAGTYRRAASTSAGEACHVSRSGDCES